MSATLISRLILGIRVPRTEFWTKGEFKTQCSNGHPNHGTMNNKYCSECGQRFLEQFVEQPTDLLLSLAILDEDVKVFWETLCTGERRPLIGFGLFPVVANASIAPYADREMILGVDLLGCGGVKAGSSVPEMLSSISKVSEVLLERFEALSAKYGHAFFPQAGIVW